ncbi:hypothetical protein BJX96DRAFT_69107 [Aspergillus floccosus]
MSAHHYNEVRRDGFISASGRFMAEPGRMDRIEASRLRSMFLPKLSREGQKALRDNHDFVRSQSKRYGVQSEESQFSGKGTNLMKAALQDGMCGQFPDHILKLQEQMHAEWLSGRTPGQLSFDPDWVMQKYILSADQPDRTKTTTVVGIPLDRYSQYRSGQMIKAASKVTDLYHMKAYGPDTQVILMGWNRAVVEREAAWHPIEEARRLQIEKDKLDKERRILHMDYLNSRRGQNRDATPVGGYIVVCETIERGWPGMADDLSINIHPTLTPGIFKADFDLGFSKGVVIISSNKAALNGYCGEADSDNDKETDGDSVPAEKNHKAGSQKRPPISRPGGRPKKNNAGQDQPLKYLLRLKCRETSAGMIYYRAYNGTINFEDNNFASFNGVADFPRAGSGVSFFCTQIGDCPCASRRRRIDYLKRQCGMERVRRWH